MAVYNFKTIEKKWQQYWEDNQTYKVEMDPSQPKYYVLDMFPYPSGAGLHVGHPLGYIASDIFARYKKLKGFNVLHPMGFDAYGLPAEQYAIQTGQHPAVTTEQNIKRYKEQLENMGFSYDWSREVKTCDPNYYQWTQWIFVQLYKNWYNRDHDKAEPIADLIKTFEEEGNKKVHAACSEEIPEFSAQEWNNKSEEEQQKILLHYRLAYISDAIVNWCPALGTVLANDEVKDGYSERGGHPVVRKTMKQWSLRITAYADRLLQGLDQVDWPESLKEMQRNWIGKSPGAELVFFVPEKDNFPIKTFTTRIDTIFGVTYIALAPESELVEPLTSPEKKDEVDAYVKEAGNRSERDRLSDIKNITGVFTGNYAEHPFTGDPIPIWVADYVLAGYGTGAVMAVPSSDQRDYDFAKHFDIPIIPVLEGTDTEKGPNEAKEGKMINSGFLDGLEVDDAINEAIKALEEKGIGRAKTNYRMRDAIFSRQRYWGEPFPVYFKNDIPYVLDEKELPLELPEVDSYKPTPDGQPPLARAKNWQTKDGYPLEVHTMPGWAGSSWYFFRYMDPHNDKEPFSKQAQQYWQDIDLYIGGSEHATGHLLYSRFWTKFLKDIGQANVEEPFKKLINQGMIQGRSNFVYRIKGTNKFVSYNLKDQYDVQPIHVDVNMVDNDVLDIEQFKKWSPDFADAEFILEDGKYICGAEVEKMSKSKYNVINPDDVIENYGADTLRMYEMFLGPIEQFKPWNTNGIDGVFKFLRRLWNLFHDEENKFSISEGEPTKEELKVLHKTIQKAEEDMQRLSFNTTISTLMICVNDLTSMKCNKRQILESLVILVAPYAPHIAEELWEKLGYGYSINFAKYPEYNSEYTEEEVHEYPISINGKMRAKMKFSLDMPKEDIEKQVLASEQIQKWTQGKPPKKVIIVPKKIVNIVV